MKRRPRCRPDTWSDQCHQTEWQMPGNPGLIPGQRDEVVFKDAERTQTFVADDFMRRTCLSLRLSRVKSQEEEKTMS